MICNEDCENCKFPDCVKNKTGNYDNAKYCREYYQRHKEEAKHRIKVNRYKKRIKQYGYEMALYI